ncbi:hypothetical protein MMC32_003618 [Xylographa parallela]|nr:hypothetical protein [Xylographa parallela]
MDGGNSPPGFPHPHPTDSYSQLPPHAIATHRTTPQLPTSTTFDSRAPPPRAPRAATTAPAARDGGLRFKRHHDAFGEDEALRLERMEEEAVRDITAAFVRAHAVDCDVRDVETAEVVLAGAEWAAALAVQRFRDEVQQRRPGVRARMPLDVRHGADARAYMGVPYIVGAVTYPAHTQNPYRLVCRMLELSLTRGLNLQTNTLATKIGKAGAGWEVETDRGTVRARRVVLATNGYINALHAGLAASKFLVPTRSQIAAIRPGKTIDGNPGLRRSISVEDMATGDYFMSRPPGIKGEGDVLYGGGKNLSETGERNTTDDSVVHADIANYLKHAAVGVFEREQWGDERPCGQRLDWHCGVHA